MSILEIEDKVSEIRERPLQLVCITQTGKMRTMSIRECRDSGARFLHIAVDDLDKLLDEELGEHT